MFIPTDCLPIIGLYAENILGMIYPMMDHNLLEVRGLYTFIDTYTNEQQYGICALLACFVGYITRHHTTSPFLSFWTGLYILVYHDSYRVRREFEWGVFLLFVAVCGACQGRLMGTLVMYQDTAGRAAAPSRGLRKMYHYLYTNMR
jgi:hypothetical protein